MTSVDLLTPVVVRHDGETTRSARRYLADHKELRGWLGDEMPFKHKLPFKHDSHPDAENKIRLLQILPDRGTGLCCSLLQVHIKKPEGGGYYALSYEWGTTEGQETIEINHRPFSIRRNLHLFLLELRSHFGDEVGKQLFFIDAVCIDQTNLAERNAQVRLMGKIYSEATCVHAWLGPHADGSEDVLALWKAVEQVDPLWHDGMNPQVFLGADLMQPHLAELGKSDDSGRKLAPYWTAITQITRRSYWTRLWILQEVLLAQTVFFWCGDIHLSGKTYAHFAVFEPAFRIIYLGLKRFNPVFAGEFGAGYQRLARRLRGSKKSGVRPTLQTLIENFGDALCSDVRDRVYGLIGMAQRSEDCELIVDYSKPLEVLYFEALRACQPSNRQEFSDIMMKALGLDSIYAINLDRR